MQRKFVFQVSLWAYCNWDFWICQSWLIMMTKIKIKVKQNRISYTTLVIKFSQILPQKKLHLPKIEPTCLTVKSTYLALDHQKWPCLYAEVRYFWLINQIPNLSKQTKSLVMWSIVLQQAIIAIIIYSDKNKHKNKIKK